jgi:hypothetical protein
VTPDFMSNYPIEESFIADDYGASLEPVPPYLSGIAITKGGSSELSS